MKIEALYHATKVGLPRDSIPRGTRPLNPATIGLLQKALVRQQAMVASSIIDLEYTQPRHYANCANYANYANYAISLVQGIMRVAVHGKSLP